MQKLIFIILVIPNLSNAQQFQFEQKAFDYFFDSLFRTEYTDLNTIQFDNSTEEELTEFGLLTDCFDGAQVWGKLLDNAHDKFFPKKSIDVTKVTNVCFKKRKVKSKIRMYVLQATKVDDRVYVSIGLIKQLHWTKAYFFEMDQSGTIVRWCKTGMTH